MTIVAVYNMKGGVGKTTCAVNLAYLFAASGQKTLLWDLDAQAAATFALRVKPEVAQFGKPALRNAEVFIDAIRETDHINLDLLPADFSYRNLDRFLDQLDDPQRVMRQMLAQLAESYALVMLDCPAGFSALSEAVIACSDVLLVPTIPSTLSLRTLLRLTQSLGEDAPALLPFISMVDRRKSLHRGLSHWAERHPEMFLREQIPYASSVEQVTVRRAPVPIYDASDPAAKAFGALWREVSGHLAQIAQTGTSPMATPAEYSRTLDELLSTLITDVPVQPAGQQSAARKEQASGLERDGAQVAFDVEGRNDFQALERALDQSHPRRTTGYLVHTFDTDDAALQRAGYTVQLIEEPERFLISVVQTRSSPMEGPVCVREQCSAKIDAGWAAQVLTGHLSPLSVIDRRIRHPLAGEVRAIAAERVLARVRSSEHKCVRLGPVELSEGEASASIVIEFDTGESGAGDTTHRVIASSFGDQAATVACLLGAWRNRAGVNRSFDALDVAHLAGLGTSALAGAVGGAVTPVSE